MPPRHSANFSVSFPPLIESEDMKYLFCLFVLLPMVLSVVGQSRQVPILSHPPEVTPRNLTILNSPYRETNLSITPNGRYLYFMSGRGGQSWSRKYGSMFAGKREYDGDIWYSERMAHGWKAPQVLNAPINSSQGEDEPNISPDGQTVRFQSWHDQWAKDGGPTTNQVFSERSGEIPKDSGVASMTFSNAIVMQQTAWPYRPMMNTSS